MKVGDIIGEIVKYIIANNYEFLERLIVQLKLSYLTLVIALILSIPLGIFCAKSKWVSEKLISIMNTVRVIPSLALLAIMIPYFGTGFKPSIIALIVLACPPIINNTYVGFNMINKDTLEAAKAMGMNSFQILYKVELPLSASIIVSGLKISAIEVISSATLAAFIGGGGLGEYILSGVSVIDTNLILIGTIPIAILAIFTECILDILEKKLTLKTL